MSRSRPLVLAFPTVSVGSRVLSGAWGREE